MRSKESHFENQKECDGIFDQKGRRRNMIQDGSGGFRFEQEREYLFFQL